jgi:hypothetical protein
MFHEGTHAAQNLGNKDMRDLYYLAHRLLGYAENPFEINAFRRGGNEELSQINKEAIGQVKSDYIRSLLQQNVDDLRATKSVPATTQLKDRAQEILDDPGLDRDKVAAAGRIQQILKRRDTLAQTGQAVGIRPLPAHEMQPGELSWPKGKRPVFPGEEGVKMADKPFEPFLVQVYKQRLQSNPDLAYHPGLQQVPEFQQAFKELFPNKRMLGPGEHKPNVPFTKRLSKADAPQAGSLDEVKDVAKLQAQEKKPVRTVTLGEMRAQEVKPIRSQMSNAKGIYTEEGFKNVMTEFKNWKGSRAEFAKEKGINYNTLLGMEERARRLGILK